MDSRKAPFLAPFPSRLIALAAILGFGGLVACTSEQVAEVIATGTITVSVSVEGTGAGRITVDISQLAGLACRYMAGDPSVLQGSTCNESFDDGGNAGSFTLTATPDAGMVFDRWTSGCSAATSTSCTVSFPGGTNQSVSIRAKFDDPNYVPLNVSPTEVLIREFGAVGAVSVTAAGGLVGGTPSWSSSAQSIATVSAASGSYEATITGVSPGTANVTVSAAGETATVAVTVEPPPMVLVEPGDVVMTTLGDSFTGMTARAFDDAGNPVAGAMFDWSSSAPGIVEVFATAGDGSTATVRAVGAGTATISATTTTGGSGGVDVTVKPVTQLDVQPPAATISEFGPGGALGLTATAMDAGGNEVVEAEIEWSSSDPAIATVTTNGATSAVDGLAAGARVSNATVEGVADGVVTITAKVVTRDVEAQGAEGTSTVTVQVVNTVEVTPTSSTITELGVAGALRASSCSPRSSSGTTRSTRSTQTALSSPG